MRRRRDLATGLLGVWSTVVLIVLFVPILLLFRNSFSKGRSLVNRGNGYTTKPWSDVFDGSAVWATALRFAMIVAVVMVGSAIVARSAKGPWRRMRRLGLPLGVACAIVVNGLMTEWFRELFDNRNIGDAIRNSFVAALGATVVAVALGGLAGVALARRSGRWAKPFMLVLFLILVTPEIMEAVALLGWFARLGGRVAAFDNGYLRLWIGQSLYSSAVVTLIVRARLTGLDETLEEAAADLGAPPARAFRQITLPLISSALLAGALLSFTICLDNTIISSFVSTAGTSTLPSFVLGTVRTTTRPTTGVGVITLFTVTLAALTYVFVVLRRSGESSSSIASTLVGG